MLTIFSNIMMHLLPIGTWKSFFSQKTLNPDLYAGIAAGLLVLPQAVALATLTGVPPEYGLYTAIFPVIIAAMFGSSRHNMSGPNTSLAILMAATVGPLASQMSAEYIGYVLVITLIAGVLQLLFGALRLGDFFKYISGSVILGMTAAVGILIITQQMGEAFGVALGQSETVIDLTLQLLYNLTGVNFFAVTVSLATIATGLFIKKKYPKAPHLILAIIAGSLIAKTCDWSFGSANTNLDVLGHLSLSAIPFRVPDYSEGVSSHLVELLIGGMMVAFLGAMQSAVISRAMAIQSGQNVDINKELIGQGLGNIAGGFLSSFSSCGSFNRSAANIAAGGKTQMASIISAVVLGLLVFFASPLIAQLSLSVLSGVLILVGYGLIDIKQIKKTIRVRGELAVFLLSFMITLFSGLENAVFAGVIMSVAIYLRNISKPAMHISQSLERHALMSTDGPFQMMRLSGSLFFGSVSFLENAFDDISRIDSRKAHLILDAHTIQHIDMSAASAIAREAELRQACGGCLIMLIPRCIDTKILTASDLAPRLGENLHFHAQ